MLCVSCAVGKVDLFAPPARPNPPKDLVNTPPLPIRIASTLGVVSYSPSHPSDGCPSGATCQQSAKYWAGSNADSFNLVQVGPTETVNRCSLVGVSSISFNVRAQDPQPLLKASAGAPDWSIVVIESPSGFADPVPNNDWGEGWPIQDNLKIARSIYFDKPPACETSIPNPFVCTGACLYLRVELVKK